MTLCVLVYLLKRNAQILPFLHREIGSAISARVNGQTCNDFLYDRNIDDEIFSGNLKIVKSLFHFLSY